jgi:hypothetical protein
MDEAKLLPPFQKRICLKAVAHQWRALSKSYLALLALDL